MISYLLQKYSGISLVLTSAFAVLPLIASDMPAREVIPRAFLWSGLVAPIVTYREFRSRKLWPLYDNLRLPKYLLLSLCSILNIACYLVLRAWMQ